MVRWLDDFDSQVGPIKIATLNYFCCYMSRSWCVYNTGRRIID